jgi:glycosyltransferase involved in cell wall biosynthesis
MELSIVTINLNNKEGLEKTLSSVFGQSFSDFEFIIIDGGSADGSLEIIKHNPENINYWVSEKDNGIYDAMNKGMQQASGNYIMFLNSGDALSNKSVIENCIINIDQAPGFDIYYGDMIIVNDRNNPHPNYCRYPDEIDLQFLKKDTLNHQASLFKADLFREFGLYPASFRLAADYWLYLSAILRNKKFRHLSFPMVDYDLSGVSAAHNNLYKEEKQKIWEQLVPACIDNLLNENEGFRHLLNYRIMNFARRLNNSFQKLKG